jgi:hypothetical protein
MPSFPPDAQLDEWKPDVHAPFIGLINPKSGGQAGAPILEVCMRTPVYKDRMMHIVEVIKSANKKDGLFEKFRTFLNEAKDAAKQKDAKFRPRLICGGGDGTASFALMIVFKALLANPERADEGLADTGNGFIWTDEELKNFFPALVQMPLGTGNDLAGVLGWGRKAPGDLRCGCCRGASASHAALKTWFNRALDVRTPVSNFDVWGFMPPPGQDVMDLKLCELAAVTREGGKKKFVMKEPDVVVPFLVLLYASYGFAAEVVAKFQLKRTTSQFLNTLQYGIIGAPMMCCGSKVEQKKHRMDGLSVWMPEGSDMEQNGTLQYFPPRPTRRPAHCYGEVGFLNLNSYSGGNVNGKDRSGCHFRWCICRGGATRRKPVRFDDGFMDLFRQRPPRTNLKTGSVLQTDKRRSATFHFDPADSKGVGVFMQYDGEGRFVFHPEHKPWRMDVHQVLRIPVVIGPGVRPPDGGGEVGFAFVGEDSEVPRIKTRIKKWVAGGIVGEVNGTLDDLKNAGLPVTAKDKE